MALCLDLLVFEATFARSGGLVGLVLRLVWLAFRLGRLGRQAGAALVLRLGWHIFIECEVGLLSLETGLA